MRVIKLPRRVWARGKVLIPFQGQVRMVNSLEAWLEDTPCDYDTIEFDPRRSWVSAKLSDGDEILLVPHDLEKFNQRTL